MRTITLLLALTVSVCTAAVGAQTIHTPIPGSHWVNVRDYGALGNGGDDAPGFIAAINAAANHPWGGGTVYCPSTRTGTNSYNFPHGITLPHLTNVWVEIYLDCNIGLGGTLTIQGSGYYIHGHNAGQGSNFGTMGTSQIYAGEGVSPAIKISTFGTRLENLSVSTGSGDVIQIVSNSAVGIGASSMVSLIEVHASTRNDNAKGSPLHIIGGFGYYIQGGGYEVQATSAQPTILIESASPVCNNTGIITIERVYLGNRGIQLRAPCASIQNVKIIAPLYEMGKEALVNLRNVWAGFISGVKIEDCAIADSNVAALDNQSSRAFAVKLDNCTVTGGVLTTGLPVGQLTIWYPAEPERPPSPGFGGFPVPVPPKIAQTRGYELHFGDRIINTIPVLNVDKFDVQSGFIQSKKVTK